MTEEAVENTEPPVEYTDVEKKAMELGWKPDKESLPEGKEFVTAPEYIANGKYIGTIIDLQKQNKKQGRELDEVKSTLGELSAHHKRVAEVEFQRAIESLKQQKVQALDDQDHARAVEIDDKITETKNQAASQPAARQKNPDYEEWIVDNGWYEEDAIMQGAANSVAAEYTRDNPKATDKQLYKHVEAEIKKAFPGRFATPKRERPSAVEGAGNTGRSRKAGITRSDLSPEERAMMDKFVKGGIMSEREYLNDLEKIL